MTKQSTATSKRSDTYQAFLIRVWLQKPQQQRWRASIQHVEDGRQLAFNDLEQLISYLCTELDPSTPTDQKPQSMASK